MSLVIEKRENPSGFLLFCLENKNADEKAKSPLLRQSEGEGKRSHFLSLAVIFRLGIEDLAPIEISAVERGDNDLRGGDVGCGGYVASVAFLHERGIHEHGVGVIGLFSEVEKDVDLVVRDTGSDLLNAALASGKELFDFKTGGFRNAFSGHFCGADIMLRKYAAISDTELYHEFSFCFGGYECNFHGRNPALPEEATQSFLLF